jgi:FixJ family two-component response regulator
MNNVKKAPQNSEPVIYVVDDDQAVRDALVELFLSMKMNSQSFESPSDFLARADTSRAGCIVLDVRMPGLNGLDFQNHLDGSGSKMPIIFMTGYGDIPMTVRAMKAGATDFITKPFSDSIMLDAVENAIRVDGERRKAAAVVDEVQRLTGTLTPREREVMHAVAKGLMNKQIAFELGITEMTVKLHRMSVMKKMEARSVADLVRKVEQIRDV